MWFASRGLNRLLMRMLEAALLLGIPLTLGVPFFLKDYYDLVFWMASRQTGRWFMILLLMSTGFMLLLILYEARKILGTVDKNQPFVRANVRSLQHIAVAAVFTSGAYLVKTLFYPSFLTIAIFLITLVVGLFVGVMARLFDEAVNVKEENDLTV